MTTIEVTASAAMKPLRTQGPDMKWGPPPPPCRHGDHIDTIETPALVVEMDALEKNLVTMATMMKKFPGVAWRPHYKAHKCPEIALMQTQSGACGVCCQTLVEAESLVHNQAANDIFITNQLVGKTKLQRLAVLCRQATVSICVDDPSHVVSLGLVAKEANVNIECVVEVCVGSRCGVQPGKAAVELAKEIIDTPHLSFKGIHVYGGQNQHIRSAEDRKQATDTVVEHAQRTLKEFDEADIRCPYVTGGGTGTFAYEACSGVFTEVQPGSFMFMDADYNKNLNEAGKHQELFHQSLFVLTSVQSARDGRAIVDVGLKGVSLDSGPPEIYVNPNLSYVIGGDEHGKLKANTELGQTTINKMEVGERLWLVPGHCDPTVNLHDWLVGMRHFQVEKMFAIAGRGPGV